jgi:hypothetical protein
MSTTIGSLLADIRGTAPDGASLRFVETILAAFGDDDTVLDEPTCATINARIERLAQHREDEASERRARDGRRRARRAHLTTLVRRVTYERPGAHVSTCRCRVENGKRILDLRCVSAPERAAILAAIEARRAATAATAAMNLSAE